MSAAEARLWRYDALATLVAATGHKEDAQLFPEKVSDETKLAYLDVFDAFLAAKQIKAEFSYTGPLWGGPAAMEGFKILMVSTQSRRDRALPHAIIDELCVDLAQLHRPHKKLQGSDGHERVMKALALDDPKYGIRLGELATTRQLMREFVQELQHPGIPLPLWQRSPVRQMIAHNPMTPVMLTSILGLQALVATNLWSNPSMEPAFAPMNVAALQSFIQSENVTTAWQVQRGEAFIQLADEQALKTYQPEKDDVFTAVTSIKHGNDTYSCQIKNVPGDIAMKLIGWSHQPHDKMPALSDEDRDHFVKENKCDPQVSFNTPEDKHAFLQLGERLQGFMTKQAFVVAGAGYDGTLSAAKAHMIG